MILARLRHGLDIMPSPVPERPGILIRDPMRFSEATIIVPWELASCLGCFDGESTLLDLRAALVRATGELEAGRLESELAGALRNNGFLEDEVFHALRDRRIREFAQSTSRPAIHAGSGYPAEPEALAETMAGYLKHAPAAPGPLQDVLGIAAPHVSPFGGWQSYRAAYRRLPSGVSDRTFVVLGTSHYGEPEKFGLTRKRFSTPLGCAQTDEALVNRLASRAAPGVKEEDYCHAVEHSIEFQVLFLQWLYGPEIKIVPILCGPFARSIYRGGKPEDDPGVERFLSELSEIAASEGDRLLWVLGIDMAHIGRRYGDAFDAVAGQGVMEEIQHRDAARNDRVTAGDPAGFWDLVQRNRDDLRWCGSSPLYTFLKAVPGVRGSVERYEQWNIDEKSVVSFGGLSFALA